MTSASSLISTFSGGATYPFLKTGTEKRSSGKSAIGYSANSIYLARAKLST